MLRWLSIVLLSAFLLGSFSCQTQAAQNIDNAFYNYSANYDVQLRGNGENIVTAKITLVNNREDPITSVDLESENSTIDEAITFQLSKVKKCRVTRLNSSSTAFSSEPLPEAVCDEYRTDNSYSYYPYETNEYVKLDTELPNQNTIRFNLDRPLVEDQSTDIVLLYIAKGNVTKTWTGSLAYSFKTLRTSYRTKDVRVAITADTDMYMDDSDGQIEYVNNSLNSSKESARSELMSGGGVDMGASADAYIGQIGYDGIVSKTASNLSAGESLEITGEYARDKWRFHVDGWLKVLVVLALVFAIIAALTTLRMKRRRSNNGDKPSNPPSQTAGGAGNDSSEQAAASPPDPAPTQNSPSGLVSGFETASRSHPIIEALPFYSVYARFKLYMLQRRARPMLVSLMSVAMTIIVAVVVVFSIMAIDQNSYGVYQVEIARSVAVVVIVLVAILSAMLSLILFPLWYAGRLGGRRGFIRLTFLNIVWFMVILCVSLVLAQSSVWPSDDPVELCPTCGYVE